MVDGIADRAGVFRSGELGLGYVFFHGVVDDTVAFLVGSVVFENQLAETALKVGELGRVDVMGCDTVEPCEVSNDVR